MYQPSDADRACPFVNRDDPRCGAQFNLARLDQAFHTCLTASHCDCPVYVRLSREVEQEEPWRDRETVDPKPKPLTLTVHGRACEAWLRGSRARSAGAPRLRLRATGS